MRKLITLVGVLCLAAALTACGSKSAEAPAEPEPEVEEAEVEEEPEEEPEAEPEEPADGGSFAAAEETEEEPEAEPEPEPAEEAPEAETLEEGPAAAPVAGTGEAYVNFDRLHFFINGKEYVLGETTLQQMIDDGVPFDENDIANAGNNLNNNYQSAGFRINLGEYWSAQVYVLNDSGDNKVTSECYINEIYLPNKPDQTQNILSFDFPLNMTKEELVANAGEPDDTYHYDGDNGFYTDKYTYSKESEKYFGSSDFTFEFTKDELTYITIDYTP